LSLGCAKLWRLSGEGAGRKREFQDGKVTDSLGGRPTSSSALALLCAIGPGLRATEAASRATRVTGASTEPSTTRRQEAGVATDRGRLGRLCPPWVWTCRTSLKIGLALFKYSLAATLWPGGIWGSEAGV
jgi:hypothetical protein